MIAKDAGVRRRRTLLDALIVQHRWTSADFVRRFMAEARAMGEPGTVSMAQLKRWRRGDLSGLPRPSACRVIEQLLGRPVEELFTVAVHTVHATESLRLQTGQVPRALVVPAMAGANRSPNDAYRHDPNEPAPVVSCSHITLARDLEYDSIMSSAHDASDHAAEAGRAIEETTLVQLHAEVARLAHAYASTPPIIMFTHLRRARDLAYRMQERTRRPGQLADLYLIAGQLSGLMAGVSFDSGYSDAASEQARAALTYGQVIDHPTLRGWARATLAMIAMWSGRPNEAVTHAMAGLEDVTTGDTAIRLHSLVARSRALAGSSADANTQILAVRDLLDQGPGQDPFADQIGGEFAFGLARQSLCLGATFLALDDPVGSARHTRAALELYESGPPEQRAVGGIHGARVELATAQAMATDLDAVTDSVNPTLKLGPEQRTLRLAARLHILRRQLAAPRYHRAPQAVALTDAIETFLTTAATPALIAPGTVPHLHDKT